MATPNSVSIAAGSVVVYGNATSFQAAENDIFNLNGLTFAVASRDSSYKLTLKQPWPGPDVVDAPSSNWGIVNTGPYWQSTVALNLKLTELLRKFEVGPIKWDVAQAFIQRGLYDSQPKDFIFLSLDPAPFTLYIKLSNNIGDWSAGQTLQLPAENAEEVKAAVSAAQQAQSAAIQAANSAAVNAATAQAGASQSTTNAAQASSAALAATSGAAQAGNAAQVAVAKADQVEAAKQTVVAAQGEVAGNRVAADSAKVLAIAASTTATSASTTAEAARQAALTAAADARYYANQVVAPAFDFNYDSAATPTNDWNV